jgi:hypothetical protein
MRGYDEALKRDWAGNVELTGEQVFPASLFELKAAYCEGRSKKHRGW